MSMERTPITKAIGKRGRSTLYLRREGAGERCDLFAIQAVLGDGGSAICYEACLTDEKKVGRLKEFYPVGGAYPFALTRTADNHVVSTDKHLAFAHAVEEFLAPYRLLRSLAQTQADLAGFIPDFSIYYPCTKDGTPISHGSVYIWTAPESMLVFEDYLRGVHRAPTKAPERTLYTILRTIESLTECVRILHEQGLLHLDIKPANFGISRRGERLLTDAVSLFDVNSIQALSNRNLVCHATKGFTAPEAQSGKPSNRSDIYAIGCTLFSAIVVHREIDPVEGYHASYFHRLPELLADSALLCASEVTSSVFLRWELVRILEKCLASHESQRYRSCGELIADLEQVCARLLAAYTPSPTAALPARAVLERRLGAHRGPGARLSLLYHLYKHPLYTHASNADEPLSVLVVGCGTLGQLFLDCALQLAQGSGKPCNVRILSADQAKGARDKELYLMHRPALADFFDIDGSAPDSPYGHLTFAHAEFVPGDIKQNTDLARALLLSGEMPHYIFVALGDDALNSSVAQAFATATKRLCACQIHYAHAGPPVHKTDRTTPLSLSLDFQSEPAFRELERIALNVHICWKNGLGAPLSSIKQEFKNPYFYHASLANAISIKYKLHQLGISLADPTEAAKRFQAALAEQADNVLGELVAAEHRRWVIEKACDGWTPLLGALPGAAHRDLKKKQHACLVHSSADLRLQSWSHAEWDNATERMLAELDALDRISVRRHQMFLRQAEQIRASVSPATMYPVLELRKLASQRKRSAAACAAWYTCLCALWEQDAVQARAYPALCDALLHALPSESLSPAEKLLSLVAEQVTPLLCSMEYFYYKQNDIDLVRRIPFLLTYRTDLHLAIPLQVGSGTAHFENVAAATVCGAQQITYLSHLTTEADLAALRRALLFAANYLHARELHPTIHLLLTHPASLAPEHKLDALRSDLHALGMPCRSITQLVADHDAAVPTCFARVLARKHTPVLLERNAAPLSALLYGAGVYDRFPHYRFDANTQRFEPLSGCEALAYLRTSTHLRAADLFATKNTSGLSTPPLALQGGAARLWRELYRPHAKAWRALCRLLQSHCAQADLIASIPIERNGTISEERLLLLPADAFAGAEKLLSYLREVGILEEESAVRYHTAEICIAQLYAPADILLQLEQLFAKHHLLQADALSFSLKDKQVQIYYDRLMVTDLDLRTGTVPAAELAALLTQLATRFSLLTAYRKTGTTCAFTFATRSVKELLTTEEKVIEMYIRETCQRSGLFDDIASSYEISWDRIGATSRFDLLLTKGFSTLFLDVKARDEEPLACALRLSALAKEFGIRTIPVLVMDGDKNAPSTPIADMVTISGEEELDAIDQTLLRILTGAPASATLAETQTRSAHAGM